MEPAGDKIHKGAAVLAKREGEDLYRDLITHWQPQSLMHGIDEPAKFGPLRGRNMSNLIDYMMLEVPAITWLTTSW